MESGLRADEGDGAGLGGPAGIDLALSLLVGSGELTRHRITVLEIN